LITCLGFVDASRAAATYVLKHKARLVESPDPSHRGVRLLDLIRDGEEDPLLETWKSAKVLLHKVRTALLTGPRSGAVLNAYMMAVDPGGVIPWAQEEVPDPESFLRLQVCLVPSPNAWVFCDAQQAVLAVGVPTIIDHRCWVSELNLDTQHAVHKLVLEIVFDPLIGLDVGEDRQAS
jgi:hypothetical protein